jgi:hypothetical protein
MRLRHLLLGTLLVSGCAGHKQHIKDPDRIAEERDRAPSSSPVAPAPHSVAAAAKSVKLVAKEPAKDQWEMVGKIQGEADTDDTLRAGALAEQDLKNKASLLGAALVKIDQVTPPADKGKRGKVVVFTARAYRAISD